MSGLAQSGESKHPQDNLVGRIVEFKNKKLALQSGCQYAYLRGTVTGVREGIATVLFGGRNSVDVPVDALEAQIGLIGRATYVLRKNAHTTALGIAGETALVSHYDDDTWQAVVQGKDEVFEIAKDDMGKFVPDGVHRKDRDDEDGYTVGGVPVV